MVWNILKMNGWISWKLNGLHTKKKSKGVISYRQNSITMGGILTISIALNFLLNSRAEKMIVKPLVFVPATSGQACKFNRSLLSSMLLSIFDTGSWHSPCPSLYVNVNGPVQYKFKADEKRNMDNNWVECMRTKSILYSMTSNGCCQYG